MCLTHISSPNGEFFYGLACPELVEGFINIFEAVFKDRLCLSLCAALPKYLKVAQKEEDVSTDVILSETKPAQEASPEVVLARMVDHAANTLMRRRPKPLQRWSVKLALLKLVRDSLEFPYVGTEFRLLSQSMRKDKWLRVSEVSLAKQVIHELQVERAKQASMARHEFYLLVSELCDKHRVPDEKKEKED